MTPSRRDLTAAGAAIALIYALVTIAVGHAYHWRPPGMVLLDGLLLTGAILACAGILVLVGLLVLKRA